MARSGGLLAAALGVALLGSCALPSARANTTTPARPNIVFILADDLDYEMFQDASHLPELNTLLTQAGASFTNYFVPDSLCCPSRASILRGQYVHNHGVKSNSPPTGGFARWQQLKRGDSTIATWLHTAGYRTALFGKYLNGYPTNGTTDPKTYVPTGWDEWASPLLADGYYEFDYRMNENGVVHTYGHDDSDYLGDVLAKKSADFIAAQPADQPFFLHVTPFAPHEPAVPAPRDADAFPGLTAPRPASFDQANVAKEPKWMRALPRLSTDTQQSIDALYRKRMQSMLGVGDLVQTIVDALTASGQLDNTYIVFASDNGFHLGQHRMPLGKQSAYDEDVHVPLVIRGPGITPGRVISSMTREIDLAPTFAALAGVTPAAFVDGASFAGVLGGAAPGANAPKDALIEHFYDATPQIFRLPDGSIDGDPDSETFPWAGVGTTAPIIKQPVIPRYQALRTEQFLYVEYTTGERQLYDIVKDPGELNNVVTSRPNVAATLHNRLAKLSTCARATCRP